MKNVNKSVAVLGLMLVLIAVTTGILVSPSLSAGNNLIHVEGTTDQVSMRGFLACGNDVPFVGGPWEPPAWWWWEQPGPLLDDPTCDTPFGRVKVWQIQRVVEFDGGLSGTTYNYLSSQYLPEDEYPTWRHGAGVSTFDGEVLGVPGKFVSRIEYRETNDGEVEVIRTIIEGMDGLEGLKGVIKLTPGAGNVIGTYEGWVTMGPGKHKGLGQIGKP